MAAAPRAVVVIPGDDLRADADGVLRQADSLWNVLLEDEPEAPLLLEPVDLRAKIGPQGGVLDLFEQDVELVSNHQNELVAADLPTTVGACSFRNGADATWSPGCITNVRR